MKIFRIILSLFLFGSAQNSSAQDSEEHRYIVKYKEGSTLIDERMDVAAAEHANLRGLNAQIDAQFLTLDNAEVLVLSSKEEVEAWQQNEEVEYVERDRKRYLTAENRPYGINAVKAFDVTDNRVANRKVCIIDSGYDINHPDLTSDSSVVTGYTGEYSTTPWNSDQDGHGTHVAGTIAAIGGNGVGVVGVNRNGALKMHIVKVFGTNGWVWASTLVAAVEECVVSGSNIVNMSLGGGSYSAIENAAYNRIFNDENVLLVAAAGNDGTRGYSYPASYNAVISVGATDSSNSIANFSQKNDQVDISAPGVNVLSTTPNGGYEEYSGTSMAAPHVSGVAALVWSLYPGKTAVEIRAVLQDSALDLGRSGRDNSYGYGLVDAGNAVQFLIGGTTPQPPDEDEDDNSNDDAGDYNDDFYVDDDSTMMILALMIFMLMMISTMMTLLCSMTTIIMIDSKIVPGTAVE